MLSFKLNEVFHKENLWFIADTHIGHANVIKYDRRPYSNIREHDEDLIKKWNVTIPKDGKVFHLGDFGFGSRGYLLNVISRLNGEIYFVRGNHDKSMKGPLLQYIKCDLPYCEISVEDRFLPQKKRLVVLCHYPFESWNKKHFGSWHLHGHVHSCFTDKKLMQIKNRLDVGVRNRNYSPTSFLELEKIFVD